MMAAGARGLYYFNFFATWYLPPFNEPPWWVLSEAGPYDP